MATKILDTKLRKDDIQYLLGLAKDAKQRRIIRNLFNYQLEMIGKLGLTGIDNCKQLHSTWLNWIVTGCNAQSITSRRNHHGYKAMLQHAQRLYISLEHAGKFSLARKWRDTVTTVLRSYQVCGPSKEELEHAWNDTIKNNITLKLSPNVQKSLYRGLFGMPEHHEETNNAYFVYECALSVKKYFDTIERVPREERTGFYKTLSSFVPNLREYDFSLLIKKGPHKTNKGQSIVSIFGQGLDVHALTSWKIPPGDISPDLVYNGTGLTSIEDFDTLFTNFEELTLYDVCNGLSETLLNSYKKYMQTYKHKSIDLCHNPLKPTGKVPSDISEAPGRTVLLQDKAGKTRPISIATYTVNNTLAPLHEALFTLLKRIRQDSSDQRKGIDHIMVMTSKPDAYICSADLSSATDRLPVDIQAYIIYRILKLSGLQNSAKIASYWRLLMSCTPFKDPINDEYFYYGTGQPMGVYTSWPMLALTNHILIRAAYHKAKDTSLDYLVCGDDTVIGSKEPFLYYENWMNSLGVNINRMKSHICESSDPYKVAEFCKVLSLNGEKISSLSPKLLIRASRDKAYQFGAIECIHSIIGTPSKRKLCQLVRDRFDTRRAYLPCRYGGWGLIDNRPFHTVLLEDNFIYVFTYKKLRSMVSALETSLDISSAYDNQEELDSLVLPTIDNPYSLAKMDWRLMGKKMYTPLCLCWNNLERYETFITGQGNFTPSEVLEIVSSTLEFIRKQTVPLKISSKDAEFSKSQLTLRTQRLYTRTLRNLSKGNVHTFAFGVQSISIDLNWNEEYSLIDSKEFISELDKILFKE